MGNLKSYLNSLKGKKIDVIGAGVSNTPLIEVLLKSGVETTIYDKCTRKELGEKAEKFEKLGAKLVLGENYLFNLTGDVIFRTPGLMPTNPEIKKAVARGAVLTSEIEVFFDICPCKTIAVTGSDGKTTTTSIIAELLRTEGKTVHLGGNIGTPLLCFADDMQPDDLAVVELSSFQLITMKKSPNIAVVTNLSPNHLDVHRNIDEYIEAKSHIFMHQKKADRAVFNLDNAITREYAANAPADEILFFSRRDKVENGTYLKNGTIYEVINDVRTSIMQEEDIFLPGLHNVENYLAAFAAVLGIVSLDTMRKTAKQFRGVQHRIEFVRELRGVKYYNDSIASSPSRAIAGLKSFENKNIVLIAGGKDKGIPFDELGSEIVKRVKSLILTGLAANQIRKAVHEAHGFKTPEDENTIAIYENEDFSEAVKTASKLASEGDIVLLSPACTSFDKFKNFEERGNMFKDIVNSLE